MEDISVVYHRYLRYILAKDDTTATPHDKYMALALAVRNRMVENWIHTQKKYTTTNPRKVYFLSTEYVFGRSLHHNIVNMGLEQNATDAAETLSSSLPELYRQEDEFELGSLSRGGIAASFLEGMSVAGIPAMGYGIRYDFGLYQQDIKKGKQTERPYDWQHRSHPWEVNRPEYSCSVGFRGYVEGENGLKPTIWKNAEEIKAVPFDFAIPGYNTDTVNTLRLWTSEAVEEFSTDYQYHGDYIKACQDRSVGGRVSKFLFPDDDVRKSNATNIKQYAFFVSASLKDILRRHKSLGDKVTDLDKKIVIHLNGSRLALAVVEWMRLLIDEEGVEWEKAWELTRNIFSYTSHATSIDSIEKWPVYLLEELLPRHVRIIMDINLWHLDRIRLGKNMGDNLIRDLSIIEEGEVKWVKMGHLLILGSHTVSGVTEYQSDILREELFHSICDYTTVDVKKNTLGVSYRRWLLCANKPLASLISEKLNSNWITDNRELEKIAEYVEDEEFMARFSDIKHAAKRTLSKYLQEYVGLYVSPDTLFDVSLKKIHTCKRHMLHLLYAVSSYLKIKNGDDSFVHRTHIFGGRANPSDFLAKQVVHLINAVSEVITKDRSVTGKINLIFIPNYSVSLAEKIAPAVDLSEDLAVDNCEPGELSMVKFGLNGALNICPDSRSKREFISRLGKQNTFIFPQVSPNDPDVPTPQDLISKSDELKEIFKFLDLVASETTDGHEINPLLASLRYDDPNNVLRDYECYSLAQEEVDKKYKDNENWYKTVIKNISKISWYSSDRMIHDYAKNVWGL